MLPIMLPRGVITAGSEMDMTGIHAQVTASGLKGSWPVWLVC